VSTRLIIIAVLIAAAILFIIPCFGGWMAFVSVNFIKLPAVLVCLILLGIGYGLAYFIGKRK
jgi:hypothetical protein